MMLANNSGCISENRQKLIKSAVKVIIENIVPSRVRVLLSMSEEELAASEIDIQRLFKMSQQDFELESKKPLYTDYDRLHYKMRLDPKVHVNFMRTHR